MDEANKKLAKINEIILAEANAKGLQFPMIFGQNTRAVINPMTRCALFAAVTDRAYFQEYIYLGDINNVKIEYKGEQLNQDDHDLLMQLINMSLNQPIGNYITVSINSVLSDLGRHTQQSQRLRLFKQIDRLLSGTVRLTPKGKQSIGGHFLTYISTPLDQKILERNKRNLTYRINPDLSFFYRGDNYTLIDFNKRLQLKGRASELAKWLYLFYSSHRKPYPYKVETLQNRSGSTITELKKFRQQLKLALEMLKLTKIISHWHIDPITDLVTIEKTS